MSALSKEEIGKLALLKYLDMSVAGDYVPNYFSHIYRIDSDECKKDFWDKGLITFAPIDKALTKCSIAELKRILSEHNLPVSGKKDALIDRLLECVNSEDLSNHMTKKYIALTEKGAHVLAENNIDFEYAHRYNDFYINDVNMFIKSILENNFVNLETGEAFQETYGNDAIEACKIFLNNTSEDCFAKLSNTVKAVIIICALIGRPSEIAVLTIHYYCSIELEHCTVHYAMRFIKAHSELIKQRRFANSSPNTPLSVYKIIHRDDNCTCEHCKSFAGRTFETKNALVGVNYPPFKNCQSEFCRCFVLHDFKM